jgi:hypothetical protein
MPLHPKFVFTVLAVKFTVTEADPPAGGVYANVLGLVGVPEPETVSVGVDPLIVS